MLQPLLELKVAFAGLQESGLTVEVVEAGNTTLRATASHSDYRGSGGRAGYCQVEATSGRVSR